jgi:hypothetical protein
MPYGAIKDAAMPLWLWFLIGLGTLIMVWRDHRKEARASEEATYDFPGGEALKAFAEEQARQARPLARLKRRWQQGSRA